MIKARTLCGNTLFLVLCVLLCTWRLSQHIAFAAKTISSVYDLSRVSLHDPPRPRLPSHFRCKARVWLEAMNSPHPMLLLYHYDGINHKSREDYYHLVEGRHHRFYSSIKHLEDDLNYSIYHKQQRSPRACFIIPAGPTMPDFSIVSQAQYLGLASVQKRNKTIECHHWRSVSYSGDVEMCLDTKSGAPLIIESPQYRLDILDFSVGPQSSVIFDPNRASEVKCGVLGGKPMLEKYRTF